MSAKWIDALFLCVGILLLGITFPIVFGALDESTPGRASASSIQQSRTVGSAGTSSINDDASERGERRGEEIPLPELPDNIVEDASTLGNQADAIGSNATSLRAELDGLMKSGEGKPQSGRAPSIEVLPKQLEALNESAGTIEANARSLKERTNTIQQELRTFRERMSEFKRSTQPSGSETGSVGSVGAEGTSYCAASQTRRRHTELRFPNTVPTDSSFYVVLHVGRRSGDASQTDTTQADSSSRTSPTQKLAADSAIVENIRDTVELGRLTKVRLTSPGLETKPITEIRQRTDLGVSTWKWWAKPVSEGTVTLHVAVTRLCGPETDGLQSTEDTYAGRVEVVSGPVDQFRRSAHEKPIPFGMFLLSLLSTVVPTIRSLWRWISSSA